MEIFWVIFLTWFFCGIGVALLLIKRNPWILFFGAICLTLYGGLAALESIRQGGFLNNHQFDLAGESLLLFYSVLGGALMSTALAEIRNTARGKNG